VADENDERGSEESMCMVIEGAMTVTRIGPQPRCAASRRGGRLHSINIFMILPLRFRNEGDFTLLCEVHLTVLTFAQKDKFAHSFYPCFILIFVFLPLFSV
jgi:hypothetical protein